MLKKKVVVALGHEALGKTLPEQKKAVKNAAKAIADLVEKHYSIIITHSNGPQVSMIHAAMTEFGRQHESYTVSPMSVCSAMSQGYIGYDLQNAIRAELLSRGIYKTVCTVLTQVSVNPYDESFDSPSKPIGGIMNKEQADKELEKNNSVTEIPGKGFRRIVASPMPQDIIEIDAIKTLSDAGHIVIACGGGGIPVMEQGNKLKGAGAVIEKDTAAARLAQMTDADELLILTGEEYVYRNFGKEQAEPIRRLSLEEAQKLIVDDEFEKDTILPKLQAAVLFCGECEGKSVVITSPENAVRGLEDKTGTRISG